jgi:hypothetical protein
MLALISFMEKMQCLNSVFSEQQRYRFRSQLLPRSWLNRLTAARAVAAAECMSAAEACAAAVAGSAGLKRALALARRALVQAGLAARVVPISPDAAAGNLPKAASVVTAVNFVAIATDASDEAPDLSLV